MSFVKYNRQGGKVSIVPIMDGLMNCGYSLDAYIIGSDYAFQHAEGTKEKIKALVFEDASAIPEKTMVKATFHLRAGNDAVVGTDYRIGSKATQNGMDLKDEAVKSGLLPKEVIERQTTIVLISADIVSNLV